MVVDRSKPDSKKARRPTKAVPASTTIKVSKEDILTTGELIDDYKVMEKLGQGGFGQVYSAVDITSELIVALKVEPLERGHPQDRNEWAVLQLLQGKSEHCPLVYKCGLSAKCSFVSMQLLGRSLSGIRRACMYEQRRMSIQGSYSVIVQAVRALQGLHLVGYIHRDVKGSNFVVGHDAHNCRQVFLLDYGLSKQIVLADGSHIRQRADGHAGFRGTSRYASLNAHDGNDLSRRDDFWSLFYTFVELLCGVLPWRHLTDKGAIAAMKRQFAPETFCKALPPQLGRYVTHLRSMNFADMPDYELIVQLHQAALADYQLSDARVDWLVEQCYLLPHWKPPSIV